LLAANRMIFAIVVPNDFSPPIASTGMGSLPFDGNCWLSVASWSNAANCRNRNALRLAWRTVLNNACGPLR
jgi:hypothetical protein